MHAGVVKRINANPDSSCKTTWADHKLEYLARYWDLIEHGLCLSCRKLPSLHLMTTFLLASKQSARKQKAKKLHARLWVDMFFDENVSRNAKSKSHCKK